MEAEKINLPDGTTACFAAAHTLSPVNDKQIKQVSVAERKAVAFYIGGAADKESYYTFGPDKHVEKLELYMRTRLQKYWGTKYISKWLDYSEAKGWYDIEHKVIKLIPNKSSPVYIVGHSLGGWNGAHLSQILTDKGYVVKLLVTLDPVGRGFLVSLGSDIHFAEPKPKAEQWINVCANPSTPDDTDGVANFGEKWLVSCGPDINDTMDANHYMAMRMFDTTLSSGKSAATIIHESITDYLG